MVPPACLPRSCCCVQAESWNVEHKADESPLTRADKEANAVICDGLARIGGYWCCHQAGLGAQQRGKRLSLENHVLHAVQNTNCSVDA